jgi:transposase-like protein
MTLALLGNTLLRTAITRNLVSFPAQIRPFMKRSSGDLQERIVQLYFVRGWTVRSICDRYGLSKAMAHKLLAEWRIRAVESGYIQEIEPGKLAGLVERTEVGGAQPSVPVYLPVPMENPATLSAGSGA